MKLTKEETDKIIAKYSLGDVMKVDEIKGGNINYNFVFKTEKGEYIVRVLGYRLDKYWKRQKELEFKVLDYLIAKKFPYEVPNFLKNNKGKNISEISGKLIEVYPRIKGNKFVKLNEYQVKEMAKALTVYHKFISGYNFPKKFKRIDDYKWLAEELKNMNKIKPKNGLDRFMLKHVDTFIEMLNFRNEIKLDRLLIGHHDFHKWNLLFNNDKLVGILDFENVGYGPRISDIFFDPDNFRHSLLFIKEYNGHNKLTKNEIDFFIKNKLLGNCYHFRWAYKGTLKNENKRMHQLKQAVNKYKKYLEFERILKKKFFHV